MCLVSSLSFLNWCTYVCMSMWVAGCACGWEHVHVCARACRGQPQMSSFVMSPSPLRKGLSLAWSSLTKRNFMATKPQGPACLHLPALKWWPTSPRPDISIRIYFDTLSHAYIGRPWPAELVPQITSITLFLCKSFCRSLPCSSWTPHVSFSKWGCSDATDGWSSAKA